MLDARIFIAVSPQFKRELLAHARIFGRDKGSVSEYVMDTLRERMDRERDTLHAIEQMKGGAGAETVETEK